MDYLYFELTRRCNQRCIQCFNNSRDALRGELGTAEVLAVLDCFKDQGGQKLQLTGGDPLLRRDLPEILDHVGRLAFDHVVLSTNGMLLKDKLLDRVERVVDEVDISLDGFGSTHDHLRGITSFDLTVDTLRRVAARDVRTYVCCCLTPDTWGRIEDFLDLLVDIGIDTVKLAQIGEVGRKMTPSHLRDATPDTHAQFARITTLAMRYHGRIGITQSHTTSIREPDIDRDGLVCDPCGRLYPMIGYLPLHWQVGTAHPDWRLDRARLDEYEAIFRATLEKGVEVIIRDGAINWWTLLHEELDAAAPRLDYAV